MVLTPWLSHFKTDFELARRQRQERFSATGRDYGISGYSMRARLRTTSALRTSSLRPARRIRRNHQYRRRAGVQRNDGVARGPGRALRD
jgi:hypothetical protein